MKTAWISPYREGKGYMLNVDEGCYFFENNSLKAVLEYCEKNRINWVESTDIEDFSDTDRKLLEKYREC